MSSATNARTTSRSGVTTREHSHSARSITPGCTSGVHDISAHAPFRQLASRYSSDLERQLERVRDAFDWQNEGKAKGIWAPIQDVLGQRFTSAVDESDAALLSYRDMCELLDSGQPFKYGPFMRLLDVYWETLRLGNVQAIRAELENTLAFIERHPLRDELRQ